MECTFVMRLLSGARQRKLGSLTPICDRKLVEDTNRGLVALA